jgi:hypothetical protein
MTRCIELDCRRERLAGYSRCEACLHSLFLRLFGRNADYPVRKAA